MGNNTKNNGSAYERDFSEILKELRDKLRMTQDAVLEVLAAAGIEVTHRTYQNWEGGHTKPRKAVQREVVETIERSITERQLDQVKALMTDTQSRIVGIPLVTPEASAGEGRFPLREEIADFIIYHRDSLRRDFGVDPSHIVAFTIHGNSMQPTLAPGERVLVAKYFGEPLVDGAIYVFHRNDVGIVVKRLFWKQDGTLLLLSDNPDSPVREMTIRPEEEDEWRVIGRVLRVEKNL